MSLLRDCENREHDLTLEAFGGGVAADETFHRSLEEILSAFRLRHGRDPIDVSYIIEDAKAYGLDHWFTSIAPGYLDQLPTLKELVLPGTVEYVGMTPALETLMKEIRTLIRGPFDSYAEGFAGAYSLPFRPANQEIARHELEGVHEITVLTLTFRRDGTAFIREDIRSPGSFAGHGFGGAFFYELPRRFYLVKSAEQIAGEFRDIICEEILKEGRLAAFIGKAREKDKRLFWKKNRW